MVKWLAHPTLDLKVNGPRLGLGRPVVSLDKKLDFTFSLSTQIYKWVPTTKYQGQPIPLFLHVITSCHKNWVKVHLTTKIFFA